MNLRDALVAPRLHDPLRSVELVRVVLAVVLLSHPLHALVRPADARELGAGLAARGIPLAGALAWVGLGGVLVAGVMLLVPRWAARGALVAAAVVAPGSAALYAPNWYVVGGSVEAGHPGLELSVLVLVLLAAVGWTWRGRSREDALAAAKVGFLVASLGSAALLVPHGYGPFVRWDFEGMRRWGEGMSAAGFPCGVALVWGVKVVEQLSCWARLGRRFVLPACLGHLCILITGIFIDGEVTWFDVGPGEGGCEYSVLLIAGALATVWAYLPRSTAVERLGGEPATT